MAANMYDQAAQAQFINTYAPINFGELYRIGAVQKEEIDRAAQQFGAQLQKFGEFRSPSTIDTQRYYDLTTGRQDIQNAINQMVSNPDALKDASFRSSLQSLINNIDYASLSQLKESADNQRLGLQTRSKMMAEGRYNREWDDSDIPTYDTLGEGRVFDDITPVAFMNANELSTPYFNDLKKGFLGTTYVNGTRYIVRGNNMEDLYQVASAKFNDLIDTPQGRKYYESFLKRNDGDQNAARSQFIDMIAQSQIDRTIRPDYEVDPAFIQSMKNAAKGVGQAATGALPDLTWILATTTQDNMVARLGGLDAEERNQYASGNITPELQEKIANNVQNNIYNIFETRRKSVGYKKAADLVIANMSEPMSEETDANIILKEGKGTMNKGFKVTNDTGEMTLAKDMAFNLMGYENGSPDFLESTTVKNRSDILNRSIDANRKFQAAWYNNQFRDVLLKGNNSTFTDGSGLYHNRKAYVPVDELENIGFTLKDMALVGKLVRRGDIIDQDEITIKQQYDPETGEVLSGSTTEDLTRKKIDKAKMYVEVDALQPLSVGRNEITVSRNADYENLRRKIGTKDRFNQAVISSATYLGR